MINRLEQSVSNKQPLVCYSRREFEPVKQSVFKHDNYLTHYYYKFSDIAMVGICLRVNK